MDIFYPTDHMSRYTYDRGLRTYLGDPNVAKVLKEAVGCNGSVRHAVFDLFPYVNEDNSIDFKRWNKDNPYKNQKVSSYLIRKGLKDAGIIQRKSIGKREPIVWYMNPAIASRDTCPKEVFVMFQDINREKFGIWK